MRIFGAFHGMTMNFVCNTHAVQTLYRLICDRRPDQTNIQDPRFHLTLRKVPIIRLSNYMSSDYLFGS
jgi:hypothetical protein